MGVASSQVNQVAAQALAGIYTKKITVTSPLLKTASGVCTWTIANTLETADVIVQVIEASTNNVVFADTNITSVNINITFNSSADIAAGTYKMVGIGI